MNAPISQRELETKLRRKLVCEVLDDIYRLAQHWNKGGAPLHRVRAMGYLAQTGAENIRKGRAAPITGESTFEDMKKENKEMYSETLRLLYPLVRVGVYTP